MSACSSADQKPGSGRDRQCGERIVFDGLYPVRASPPLPARSLFARQGRSHATSFISARDVYARNYAYHSKSTQQPHQHYHECVDIKQTLHTACHGNVNINQPER
jgi:hypothetical protein